MYSCAGAQNNIETNINQANIKTDITVIMCF